MTCTEFEELSGAYVLDAITPEEREAAEAHLATCAKCTRLVNELRPVIDLLPLSVLQIEARPELKERILAAIQSEENLARPTQRVATPPRRKRPPRPTWRRWSTGLLAAAAVLLLFLMGGMGAWNISLQQQLTASQQQLVASQQRVAALTPVFYSIRGTSPTSDVTGQLIYYPQQHITVLVMHGLPQLEGTHVYQGWLIEGKQPISIGLLNMKNGVATVDFSGNPSSFSAAAISVEPGPKESLPAPKGAVVALGTLAKPGPSA